MPDPSGWLTVKEVAPLLGIGAKNVYQMASLDFPEDRRIPCYRLGPRSGKIRFKREEIEAYIKNLRPKPEASHRDLGGFRPRLAERRRPRP